jgi:hypothetical protein
MNANMPTSADCWTCAKEAGAAMIGGGENRSALAARTLYLCSHCGGHRCPKSDDHRNQCAGYRVASVGEAMGVVDALAVRHAGLLVRLAEND